MRVLCDTNVLARAATRPHGPAFEVIGRLLASPEHALLVSPFLLDELTRVLGYTRLRLRSVATAEEIARFLDDLEQASEIVEPTNIESLVPRDSGDDPVIAGAVAGRADVLCTRDQHLYDPTVLEYCRNYAIEVLDDVALLGRLRDAEGSANQP